jgi:hypothetical protein
VPHHVWSRQRRQPGRGGVGHRPVVGPGLKGEEAGRGRLGCHFRWPRFPRRDVTASGAAVDSVASEGSASGGTRFGCRCPFGRSPRPPQFPEQALFDVSLRPHVRHDGLALARFLVCPAVDVQLPVRADGHALAGRLALLVLHRAHLGFQQPVASEVHQGPARRRIRKLQRAVASDLALPSAVPEHAHAEPRPQAGGER